MCIRDRAGISLSALLAGNGWIGQYLAPHGIELAFNRNGIVIALIFIGLPFVVRTVQPVSYTHLHAKNSSIQSQSPRGRDSYKFK